MNDWLYREIYNCLPGKYCSDKDRSDKDQQYLFSPTQTKVDGLITTVRWE